MKKTKQKFRSKLLGITIICMIIGTIMILNIKSNWLSNNVKTTSDSLLTSTSEITQDNQEEGYSYKTDENTTVTILPVANKNKNNNDNDDDDDDQKPDPNAVCTATDRENEWKRFSPIIKKEAPGTYIIYLRGTAYELGGARLQMYKLEKGTFNGYAPGSSGWIEVAPDFTRFYATPAKMVDSATGKEIPGSEQLVVSLELAIPGNVKPACRENFYIRISYEKQGDPVIIYPEDANEENKRLGMCQAFYNGEYNAKDSDGQYYFHYNNGKPTKYNTNISKEDFEKFNPSVVSEDGKKFYNSVLNVCQQAYVLKGTNYTKAEMGALISDALTAWKATMIKSTNTNIDAEIAKIRNKAAASGNSQNASYEQSLNVTKSLKCSWKKKATSSNYFVNESNYYAKKVVEKINATYVYNIAPGAQLKSNSKACERVCEEAVKVEYGPPVATKAGLCFEYKVKITSYVKCETTNPAAPPLNNGSYCSPAPGCNNGIPGYYRQAGPTEEYEQCIQNCDGGKYTSSCSRKCYKKIYENGNAKLDVTYENKLNATQLSYDSELAECLSKNSDGCYVINNGAITWVKGSSARGRWYNLTGYHWEADYYADSMGIKRHRNSDGSSCQDVCWWEGCEGYKTGQYYLNPGSIAGDVSRNVQIYKDAVKRCQAAASCSSRTAEIKMSVKYDAEEKGKIVNKKIEFPYNSSKPSASTKDQLSSLGTESKMLNTVKGSSSGSSNRLTPVTGYAGCYEDAAQKRWYQIEMQFPGVWINTKSGATAFTPQQVTNGWYEEKGKFCMPLNSTSVNSKWWEWRTLNSTCITEADIENELKGKTGTSDGYNIEADVENFGYFGWNLNVKCFYASRNEQCNINNKTDMCCTKQVCTNPPCDDPGTVDKGEAYVIRTVSLKNLFPNSGDQIDPAKRRDIGFNWTSAAATDKNQNYTVSPVQLMEDIQNNADAIYTDTYKDYEFYLSPSTLNKIREYNNGIGGAAGGVNYGEFEGSYNVINGVTTYKSKLFRDGGILTGTDTDGNTITKATGKIGENNSHRKY